MNAIPDRQVANVLAEIVDSIEQFLLDQVDRLELQMNQFEMPSRPDGDLTGVDEMLTEFEKSCGAWQRQYEIKKRELEEDCNRLAEAWERIENEQRQMLAQRSIQQAIQRSPDTPSEVSDLRSKTPTSLTPINESQSKRPLQNHPTRMTYRQLQQQMRSHGKRKK